jgi:hypothetical protein
LSDSGAGIVANGRRRKHPEQGENPSPHVTIVKVGAERQIFQLHFAGTENFARSAHGVIDRLIEVLAVKCVRAEFATHVFAIERRIVLAGVAVHPGGVIVGERRVVVHRRRGGGSRWRGRCGGLRGRRSRRWHGDGGQFG